MFKILITGGHLTPALALIDYCQSQPEIASQLEFVFAGREWAQTVDGQKSWEKTEVSRRQIKFINFAAVKTGAFNLGGFFQSFLQAKKILQAEKIDLLLSFGGYLALPFALAAGDLKIPLITHEQTRVLGRANRLIAALADKLAVSFPHTSSLFLRKTVITGNPLRPAIFASGQKSPSWFTYNLQQKNSLPLLYISGGSQGSQTINENVLPLLPELSRQFVIIHQLGRRSVQRQPLQMVTDFLATPIGRTVVASNYFPREFLSETELAFFYPRLDLALARSGANTVAELTAFAIPSLFIPLPFANYREQEKNAQFLVKNQAALILSQVDLNQQTLIQALKKLQAQAPFFRQQLKQFASSQQQAVVNLCQLIIQVLQKHSS